MSLEVKKDNMRDMKDVESKNRNNTKENVNIL